MNQPQTALLEQIKTINQRIAEATGKLSSIESAIVEQACKINALEPIQDTHTELENSYRQALALNSLGANHDIKNLELAISKALAADEKANKQRIEDEKSAVGTIAGLQSLQETEKNNHAGLIADAKAKRLELLHLIGKENAEVYEKSALAAIEALRNILAVDTVISRIAQDARQSSNLLAAGNFNLALPALRAGRTLSNLNRGCDFMLIDAERIHLPERGGNERVESLLVEIG